MAVKLGELAQTLATADRRDADDQSLKMRKRDATNNFAYALEKSLAKKRKSVYREHRILREIRISHSGSFF